MTVDIAINAVTTNDISVLARERGVFFWPITDVPKTIFQYA